ncbi:MAG: phosphatidate cytidylyltransferase [Thermoanaerobaculum sp.]|nr:phosphatidate cytidylyltransferase [Thermoanaerobaculum sp.]MDW7968140.1 phosphatidate cytidylyltransferase [Thermoanaerobaculum sp.]
MGTRETTAFVLLPLILAGIVLLPPWVYLGAVALVGLLAAWELVALFRAKGHPVPAAPTLLAAAVGMTVAWLKDPKLWVAFTVLCVLLVPVWYLLSRAPLEGASAGMAGSLFIACYFAVTAGAMGLLRLSFSPEVGWKVVLLHCLTIWGGDSGAYYVGVKWGKHKMAPRVSPKKSWEGIVGGTAVTFFGIWFCRTVFFPELPWPLALAVGALLALLAPVGDLVESLFKRDAGVKDSSDLIPGHGGFLDRTDSLFFAAPFTWALLILLWPQ